MLRDDAFASKVVLITGAGTGIGAGFARRVAQLGGIPVLTGRRIELLDAVAASYLTGPLTAPWPLGGTCCARVQARY